MKPALMLPMGREDYEAGDRMNFLRSVRKEVESLGWCIGIQTAGPSLKSWGYDCFREIQSMGGRIVCHAPDVFGGRGNKEQPPEEQLKEFAEQVRWYKEKGFLELVTIHLKPIVTEDPPRDAGLDRYNSSIDAAEMLKHLEWHVQFLEKLNRATGGILSIENVSLTNFCEAGHRLPTYLSLRAGGWWDLIWLACLTGVNITFDSEHFIASGNLLERRRDLRELGRWSLPWTREERDLASITGYRLARGFPPRNIRHLIGMFRFVSVSHPKLYHLGGAIQDMVTIDDEQFIDTHRPIDNRDEYQRHNLDLILKKIVETGAIGAVIEVCGNLQPDKYDPWSPRPESDEVAKMQSYLTVIDEIDKLQKGK